MAGGSAHGAGGSPRIERTGTPRSPGGGGILALDVARRTGWATATPEAVAAWPCTRMEAHAVRSTEGIRCGTVEIARSAASHGALYHGMERWLCDFLAVERPRIVVLEAPLPRIGGGAEAARRLMGMAAMVDYVCHRLEIRTFEASVNTVKKHWINNGCADKSAVYAEARARGFQPQDDNAADALALLDYAAVQLGHMITGGGAR